MVPLVIHCWAKFRLVEFFGEQLNKRTVAESYSPELRQWPRRISSDPHVGQVCFLAGWILFIGLSHCFSIHHSPQQHIFPGYNPLRHIYDVYCMTGFDLEKENKRSPRPWMGSLLALTRIVIVLYHSIMPIPTSYNMVTKAASRTWIILFNWIWYRWRLFDMDFGSLQQFIFRIL